METPKKWWMILPAHHFRCRKVSPSAPRCRWWTLGERSCGRRSSGSCDRFVGGCSSKWSFRWFSSSFHGEFSNSQWTVNLPFPLWRNVQNVGEVVFRCFLPSVSWRFTGIRWFLYLVMFMGFQWPRVKVGDILDGLSLRWVMNETVMSSMLRWHEMFMGFFLSDHETVIEWLFSMVKVISKKRLWITNDKENTWDSCCPDFFGGSMITTNVN